MKKIEKLTLTLKADAKLRKTVYENSRTSLTQLNETQEETFTTRKLKL